VFQRFIKPLVKAQDKSDRNAFLTLMNDKWYFQQLRNMFVNQARRPLRKKLLQRKSSLTKEYKASIFYQKDAKVLTESRSLEVN
jgi:hypothetical protein